MNKDNNVDYDGEDEDDDDEDDDDAHRKLYKQLTLTDSQQEQ